MSWSTVLMVLVGLIISGFVLVALRFASRIAWFHRYFEQLDEMSVIEGPRGTPYACPCCGYLTLDERGGYEICPVCCWEDDGQDDPYADQVRGGPNGRLSLAQARRNFAEFRAKDPKWTEVVRAPLPDEILDAE